MISSATDNQTSSDSFASLTSDQQQRLTQLLDQYLCGLEQGEPVNVPHMIRGNPDLADALRGYLAKLEELHGVAAGFQQHGELEPLVTGEPGSPVKSLQLGEYTIVRELGRGGMGIVYEARQGELGRRVALKLLPMASMLDSRQIARFKNESRAAAQLQHPNIATVYSVGIERGIHFYAMQLIDGHSIDAWIADSAERGSERPWRETVRIAINAADALHCAHECGIVHRDVKPSNLMLEASGKVWVTDFGLARCQNDLSLTLSGHLIGTMRYMSPEQAGGRAEMVDHRTDVYSLGVTLYEMLCGRAAVRSDDGPSMLNEIATGAPTPLRRLVPTIPHDLDVVLRKAMSREKDDRYATAREFAEDLAAVLENRPTLAKPPSAALVASRWASRHSRLVATTTLVVLIGLIGTLASLVIIAEKNRDVKASYQRADAYFRQAQETVDQLGNRVAQQLASVPGTEHIRQSVLRDTRAYYEQFVAQATGDPHLRGELALTHSRIGSLVKELESADASIDHFRKSDSIYREIVAESTPAATAHIQAMADNLNQLGLARFAVGQLERAQSSYQRAIELQQQLAERDRRFETELALTKNNLGLVSRELGEIELAEAQWLESIETLGAAVTADDQSILAARGLSAALVNLSSLSLKTDPEASIELLQSAIDHQLRISRGSASRLKSSIEIATTYNNLGAAYLAAEDSQQAIDAFSNAVKIQRRLHSIAPLVDSYQLDLAMSLNNLAAVLHRAGHWRQAEDAARDAISSQSAYVKRVSGDAAALSRLGVMHSNLGKALKAQGEHVRAADTLHEAVIQQQAAVTLAPSVRPYRRHLLSHHSELLKLQVAASQWHDATATRQSYIAAADQSSQFLNVAEDMAKLSEQTPAGIHRDRAVADIATALASARSKGANVESSLLLRQPFRIYAHLRVMREAVQP